MVSQSLMIRVRSVLLRLLPELFSTMAFGILGFPTSTTASLALVIAVYNRLRVASMGGKCVIGITTTGNSEP